METETSNENRRAGGAPCVNVKCSYYHEKFEQNCSAEFNGGWPHVSICDEYISEQKAGL